MINPSHDAPLNPPEGRKLSAESDPLEAFLENHHHMSGRRCLCGYECHLASWRLHIAAELRKQFAVVELLEWSQAEQLFRDRDADHAWNHRCAEADVRCLDCDLRYGERQEYACYGPTTHSYSDAELAEARQCDDDCPPWSRFRAGDRSG